MKKILFAAIVVLTTFGVLAQEPQPDGESGGRKKQEGSHGSDSG